MFGVSLVIGGLYRYYLLSSILIFDLTSSKQRCGTSEFECRGDEECISKEFLCDGLRDCIDGSDETTDLCKFRSCRPPLDYVGVLDDLFAIISGGHFRCSYGACIPWLFKCDGIKNCFDGSDETEEICQSHRCRHNQFQCSSGTCIHRVYRCNGRVDCFDRSDETEKLCATLRPRCRPDYFRCDYGACIYGIKKCNGKFDCADHSDEAPELCEYEIHTTKTKAANTSFTTTTTSNTTSATITATTLTTTKKPSKTPPTTAISPLPTPTKASTTPLSTFKTSPSSITFISKTTSSISPTTPPVTMLPNFTSPNMSQPATSSPVPSDEPCPEFECLCPSPLQICVFCPLGRDVDQICEAIVRERGICSTEAVDSVHIEVLSCGSIHQFMTVDQDFVRRQDGPCGTGEEVPANTVALVDCWGKFSEQLTCQQDGRWYPQDVIHSFAAMDKLCQPSRINSNVCGMLPSARRGDTRKFTWPFLVGLLDLGEFFCWGTLVASQWVLTTASCVEGFQEEWNDTGELALTVQSPDRAKQLNVSAIYPHPHYKRALRFSSDISLLKLETRITLTEKLVPACLMQSQVDISGFLAATLMAEDSKSSNWKLITQTLDKSCFDPQNNCSSRLEGEDQFCSKPRTANILHYGPPGAPYLINGGTESNDRWTIAGVFSYVLQTSGCSSRPVFVSVSKHWNWIRNCIEMEKCSVV